MRNQLNSRKFFSAMAFVALVLSGIALVISKIVFPETEALPGISGRGFKDDKALAHALWADWYASDM